MFGSAAKLDLGVENSNHKTRVARAVVEAYARVSMAMGTNQFLQALTEVSGIARGEFVGSVATHEEHLLPSQPPSNEIRPQAYCSMESRPGRPRKHHKP